VAHDIRVKIIGDAASLVSELRKAAGATATFGSKMEKMGANVAGVGKKFDLLLTAPIVAFGALSVKTAIESEASMAKLEQSFKNAHQPISEFRDAIEQAESKGRDFGFTNDQTRETLAKFETATYSGEKSLKLLGAAEDLARFKHLELSSAGQILTGALAGNTRAIKALGVPVVAVTKNVDALRAAHVKNTTEQGRALYSAAKLADKQATVGNLIETVTKKVHGQAKAFGETAAGKIQIFQAQLDNLRENLGTTLLPILNKLLGYLDRLVKWFDSLSPSTKKWILIIAGAAAAIGPVLTVVGGLITILGGLADALIFVAANPVVLLIGALVAIGAAIAAAVLFPKQFEAALEKMGVSADTAKTVIDSLRTTFEVLKTTAGVVFAVLKATVLSGFIAMVDAFKIFRDLLRGDWGKLWNDLKSLMLGPINAIVNVAKTTFAALAPALAIVWNLIKSAASTAWNAIRTAILNVWTSIKTGVSSAASTVASSVTGVFTRLWGAVTTAASTALTKAKTIGTNIVNGIVRGMAALVREVKGALDRLWGIIATVASMAYSGAIYIGQQIINGIVAGIKSLAGRLTSAAGWVYDNTIGKLGSLFGIGSPSRVAAEKIGKPLAEGIIVGFTNYFAANGAKLAVATKKATELLAQVRPAIEAAGRTLGLAHAVAIAQGIAAGSPTIKQQMVTALHEAVTAAMQTAVQAIQTAQGAVTSATGSLASAALAAFDAQVAKWVSPAQKILDALDLKEKMGAIEASFGAAGADLVNQIGAALEAGKPGLAKSLLTTLMGAMEEAKTNAINALTAANADLANAQAALTAAQAGGDKDAISAAEAAVQTATENQKAMQSNLDAIVAAQKTALQLIAQEEATAHTKLMDQRRTQFQNQLDALNASLANHRITYEQYHKRVLDLFKKYIPDYRLSGKAIGFAIADGLRDAIEEVKKAAGELADAIAAKLKLKSPAEEGPLSTLDTWWSSFTSTLLSGLDRDPFAAAYAASGTIGGGGPTVHIHVDTVIGNDLDAAARQLAAPIRLELTRHAQRNR